MGFKSPRIKAIGGLPARQLPFQTDAVKPGNTPIQLFQHVALHRNEMGFTESECLVERADVNGQREESEPATCNTPANDSLISPTISN